MSVEDTRADAVPSEADQRWKMLVVLAIGFISFTFNWFVMPSTFGQLGREFDAGIGELATLVSVFVGGYAVMHIPAGVLGTRFGLRTTMVVGLGLEGVLTAVAGWVGDYQLLLLLRVAAGAAASVYAGLGIAAVSSWFRGREHALALGVVSASFSIGVGIGLYLWSGVVSALGWRSALVLAGLVAVAAATLVAVVYRPPAGADSLAGVRLSKATLIEVMSAPQLWRYGMAFFVGYGGYFVVSQLIGTYALDSDYSSGVAGIAALLAGVGGLPGSLLAGWLADRAGGPTSCFVGFVLLEGAGALLIPVVGAGMLWLPALMVGFGFNACFAVWQSVPADLAGIAPEHIGTAIGVMLTIGGVGGFVVPWVFGVLVQSAGYAVAWAAVGVGMLACLGLIVSRRTAPQIVARPAPVE